MAQKNQQSRSTTGVFSSGMRLGRVAGIDIVIDWSILVIFFLVALTLGMSAFPQWHPDWSPLLTWTVALAAAILFFGSVLAHELSHALTARAFGVQVERITLFIFGGMAQMRGENRSPGAEFLVAVVGPLTSFVIGGVAVTIGVLISAVATMSPGAEPSQVIASLGPVATLLLWLGPINLFLGAFNLVPGFPLDGGRVLRALIWWATGDMEVATRWAARVGQIFALILIGMGLAMTFGVRIPPFGAGLLNGLWLILIGWFLNTAARSSYQQFMLLSSLQDVPVAEVMRSRVDTVSPDTTVDVLVRDHIMTSDQQAFPVTSEGSILGLVALEDVRRVPHEAWPRTRVNEVMTGADQLTLMNPDDEAKDALGQLAQRDVGQIPVVEDGHLLGVVRRQDIVKWLGLRNGPSPA